MALMSPQDMKPRLAVQLSDEPELYVEAGNCVTIGRSPDNSLVLSDAKISRHHAEVRLVSSGQYRLSDLGSANGTLLNGRRLTAPRELQNGDIIQIGTASLRFETRGKVVASKDAGVTRTVTHMANETMVVLVSDIRSYTSMTESLPAEKFSRFIKDWFRESANIIESRQGVIDKFIGDAFLCFWPVFEAENPVKEIKMALNTAEALIIASQRFSKKLSALFPGHRFRIGVGISMGNALMGNVGTAENQSITIVGDSVNIAFRLEALTKQKQASVIVGANLVPWVEHEYKFNPLGDTEVKGRSKPVTIYSLVLDKFEDRI
jgi:adenylate cyclase